MTLCTGMFHGKIVASVYTAPELVAAASRQSPIAAIHTLSGFRPLNWFLLKSFYL